MSTPVDFDYDGPPVTVSNGMAAQLVTQFGPRNAWFAFLKLRGRKLSHEEAETARPAFAYFCNKIAHLRREEKEMNERGKEGGGEEKEKRTNELEDLMGADFDDFMVDPNSLELREDATNYATVEEKELMSSGADLTETSAGAIGTQPTKASLLEMIEQNSKRQKQKTNSQTPNEKQTGETPPSIAEGKCDKEGEKEKPKQPQNKEVAPAVAGTRETKTGGNEKKSKRTEKEDDPSTKQVVEKLLAAKEEIARRHAETIDDVVSLVMEKIKNNQPFEGELAAGSTAGPPKSHHKRAGGGVAAQRQKAGAGGGGQRKETEEKKKQPHGRAEMAAAPPVPPPVQIQQQQYPVGPTGPGGPATATLPPGIMATASANAFSNLPPGQSIVLLHNPVTGTVQQLPSNWVAPPPGTAVKMHSDGTMPAPQSLLNQQQFPPDHQMTFLGNFPSGITAPSSIASAGGLIQTTSSGGTSGGGGGGHHHHSKKTASASSSHHHHPLYQQSHQAPQFIGQLMESGVGEASNKDGSETAGQPIELTIQQNMTVQELIQTLKAQSKQQNTQIILHHNPAQTLAISGRQPNLQQSQQETPDSSSQEASMQERYKSKNVANKQKSGQKGQQTQPTNANVVEPKKSRKKKSAASGAGGVPQMAQQTTATTAQMMPQTAMEMGKREEAESALKKEEPAAMAVKTADTVPTGGTKKQAQQKAKKVAAKAKQEQQAQNTPTSPAVTEAAKALALEEQKKQEQEMVQLESEMRKANKQLAAERNKSTAQKKRAEKLQAELDKALDSIQLLQIDLACQKTDNNNLIAENIALKAENQQLRSKGQRATGVVTSQANLASLVAATQPSSTSTAAPNGAGRGRKKKAANTAEQEEPVPNKIAKSGRGRKQTTEPAEVTSPSNVEEKTPPPYILSSELGRRQSKRICVARNQFMKNLF